MLKSQDKLLIVNTLHILIWVELVSKLAIVRCISLIDETPKVVSAPWPFHFKLTHFDIHLLFLKALLFEHSLLRRLVTELIHTDLVALA